MIERLRSGSLRRVPLYEYRCRTCETQFELLVRRGDDPTCPRCAGGDLEKLMSAAAVGRGGAVEGALADAPAACGRCGDPRGPGACALG